MRYVARDPFARETIVKRVSVRLRYFLNAPSPVDHKGGCKNCGNYGRDHGNAVLWEFGQDADHNLGIVWETRNSFCSKRCHDQYYS